MLTRGALFLFSAAIAAQQLTFDAASVKPAPRTPPDRFEPGPPGGPGTSDPGRIRYSLISMKSLLMKAYDVKSFQVVGPEWLASERFDIAATMPSTTTKAQLGSMLQSLLAERFKLAVHREQKQLPLYSLGIAKGGPRMKESAADSGSERPRTMEFDMADRIRLAGYRQTMQDLADRLSGPLSRPVIDATGLSAEYDFELTFSREGAVAGPETPPDIFAALPSQLGLKLESRRGPVDLIVIDHMERTPTAN